MEKINSINLLPLELISNKIIKKRIEREILILEQSFLSLFFYVDDKMKCPVLMIVDEKYKNNNIYYIIFHKNYPFCAPTVKINFEYYFHFLNLNKLSLQILKKIHYINCLCCLCCSSILCSNNWVPSYTINNIIQEIRKNKLYKRDIIYKIMINKIKEKYLIDDINLDDWLF